MKKLKDILVIDIETISGFHTFSDLPEGMKQHWERKAAFIRNTEEKNLEELYFDRSAIYSEFGKVIVISVGIYDMTDEQPSIRVKYFASHNEKELLTEFMTFLSEKFDQETLTLCAHNGKEFDYPYICRRLLINDLPIPYVLDLSGKKPWEVNHIDTLELWKFGDRKSFTSLDLLTQVFGITSSKSDIDGSKVNDVYYNQDGLERIANYCMQDVVATAQLYLKLNAMPLIPQERITLVS